LVPKQVLDYVKKLSLGDHAVLFYESLRIKHHVLFTFLRDALERGAGALYIAGEETPEQIRKKIRKFGMDVEQFELKGALRVVNYDPLLIRKGMVNPIPEIMENLNGIIRDFEICGKREICFAGEGPYQFIQRGKIQELLEFEMTLGQTLKIPVAFICAYNTKQILPVNGDFFETLLKAHGHAIFQGIAFKFE